MNKQVYWISGWASAFSAWRNTLTKISGNSEIVCVDFEELIQRTRVPIYLNQPTVIIAWSLGGQLVPQIIANPEMIEKCILINPALNFCDAEFGWKSRVLERMQDQIPQNAPQVYAQFASKLGISSAEDESQWVQFADSFERDEAQVGLEFLKEKAQYPQEAPEWSLKIFQGLQDGIVRPENTQKNAPSYAQIQTVDCGHWALDPKMQDLIAKELNS